MALFYILSNTIGAASDPGITLGSTNSVIVNTGVLIGATANRAITGSGSGHSVTVLGTAAGAAGYTTIFLGQNSATDTENSVTVGTSGTVSAIDSNAVTVFGVNARVNNQGSITSNDVAVYMDGGAGFFASTIYNSGLIDGRFGGLLFGGSQTVTITNDGTLRSASAQAINDVGTGIQRVYNNGVIDGAVMLGASNDLYDGRRGVINGTIDGGVGNDTFLMGGGAEVVVGGLGSDTLDFRTTGGIKVALDGGFVNIGTALGDSYTGIEVINGSNSGADVLRGDALANVFYGGGGNDVMAGQAGNDALVGGNGADVLNGGLGNDVFVFASAAQGADTIVDFSNVLGNNDFFRIVAAGFGAGLTAGPLAAAKFYATNTNLAHDADDRFIFRTTDKTLWFDANGNAAGGLTMIADLQATAVVTAADIVLV